MLDVLFGSKNVTRILIFLFVNKKCYGTQLHQLLQTPLTPIQKALHRLEKGSVIMSYYEGKTRVYQFNPVYPLLEELELFLKKAYTLLPPHEKKQYINQRNPLNGKDNVLLQVWNKLHHVKELVFHSRSKVGWNGKGRAEVTVTKEAEHVLIFHEKGNWKGENHQETDFSNIFRWTLDKVTGMISLEHLRRGPNHPVFLFHLSPAGQHSLASVDTHLCEGDAYFGQIFCDQQNLRLNWRVIGNKKNEEIDYYYI